MNPSYTKAQRRRLRELGGIAHERDLADELVKVESAFRRWRGGEIDAFELSETVHGFHQGPSRELFSKYDDSNVDWAVAQAIHRGVISEEEAGADIVECLGRHLSFLRAQDSAHAAQPSVVADGRLTGSARSTSRGRTSTDHQ